MPDQTPETPRSTSGSGDEAWADDVLARARARAVAEESGDPEPAGPPPEGVTDGTASTSLTGPTADPSGGPAIVTREDLTGGPTSHALTIDGTFVVPEVVVTPQPPSELAGHPTTEPPPEVDLGIPGTIRSARRTVLEWGVVLVGALALALIVRAFLFQAFYIPSPSMEPTLSSGDRILVNKVSYRLHDVNRGDLVVFHPRPESGVDADDLIKRVIALPGETVTTDSGRVLIDGGLLIEPYLPVPDGTVGFTMVPWCANQDTTAGCTVPDDHVFVLGDNRGNSRDSRYFGPVPVDSIVGRAFVRVWPLGGLDRL